MGHQVREGEAVRDDALFIITAGTAAVKVRAAPAWPTLLELARMLHPPFFGLPPPLQSTRH